MLAGEFYEYEQNSMNTLQFFRKTDKVKCDC